MNVPRHNFLQLSADLGELDYASDQRPNAGHPYHRHRLKLRDKRRPRKANEEDRFKRTCEQVLTLLG